MTAARVLAALAIAGLVAAVVVIVVNLPAEPPSVGRLRAARHRLVSLSAIIGMPGVTAAAIPDPDAIQRALEAELSAARMVGARQ
jgi:hypothetical protein